LRLPDGVNDRTRAEFVERAFQTAGFEVLGGVSPSRTGTGVDGEDAVAAFASSGAKVAAIWGSDEEYRRIVPALAPALRGAGARVVVLAGARARGDTVPEVRRRPLRPLRVRPRGNAARDSPGAGVLR